ncbi:F-box protein SKIP16 [Elaeis guineensis]|uniref:LOW QUALITY PROTEIN: F-box protein SKIP16 n=1 Tax=Elaeis guineensis var. tenera TaxID=51953 RepID=A0A6I9QBG9_ELAGV|nr:LOW QUALITY PROTEIN: F-box protein SKIP16 [Elaeis guineensis]
MAVGLEGLGGLVLETILSKLEPMAVTTVACVSSRLRAAASDDALWRHFCARDLGLDAPLDPDGNPCPSFKETYRIWFRSFGRYPLPLVKRAKQCWVSIKSWMAVNYPEAHDTFRKGASEAEIKRAEQSLGVKLPVPTKVMFRFCDGQQTMSEDPFEGKRLATLGIIGGYEFYDHYVNVHLLPLKQIVAYTKTFSRMLGFPTRSNYIILAASYYSGKYFFLNCADGQLYVGTKNLMTDREMLPCVPQELINPMLNASNHMPQDALLLWLEEHSRRLHSGVIRIRRSDSFRSISLYPELPPLCSVAVTNGVQVRASAVLVPEESDLNREEEKCYYYAYSIRMSLLPEGCMLDGVHFPSCQLQSRHWMIRCKDIVVPDVHGEAVIGKFPLLFPDKEEFVYESCTLLPGAPGSVEGSFTFVPGRLRKPEGKQFDVKVAPFILEEPGYIF